MKVVVIASLAYSLINFRGKLLAAMAKAGNEVIACAPDRDPETEAKLREIGVKFRRIPMARTGLNPFMDIVTLFSLIRLMIVERPGLVLAYTQKPIIYGGLASRITGQGRFYALISGLGHVFGDHSSAVMAAVRGLVCLLYREALRRAKAIFVFNSEDRGELMRHRIIGQEAKVIQVPGSGVDLDHYRAVPVPEGDPIFLMIARLLRSKGVNEFIEAAQIVRNVAPGARFQLLGPRDKAPSRGEAVAVDDAVRNGFVEYLGETRDVRPFLAASTMFVLPSWYREGLPRTILEAMATGRGVITTDMPGCREPIVPDSNGMLVPPRDPTALAARLLAVVRHPGLAASMGRAARASVEARYSVGYVNHTLLEAMGLLDDPRGTVAAYREPPRGQIVGGAA